MIQYISYSGHKFYGVDNMKNSTLKSPFSLDEFIVNVIDLSEEKLWRNDSDDGLLTINSLDDFISLKTMIQNSSKTKILLVLPKNYTFEYSILMSGKYYERVPLKNELNELRKLLNYISPEKIPDLVYERTKTQIKNIKLQADFYFKTTENILTRSFLSEKPTTIERNGFYLSTVQFNDEYELKMFLKEIKLIDEKEEKEPEWLNIIDMFDDVKQKETIKQAKSTIEEQEKIIDASKAKLSRNKRYKSILYTHSNELVDVVFEIFEEMLEIDLSSFVDLKKEDLSFEIDNDVFIVEIKGLSSNVKMNNLSQLDRHYSDYIDTYSDKSDSNIYKLLVVNHQRMFPIQERKEIHDNQINAAINKYEQLIIETTELLKLFENFKNGEIEKFDVIELLKKKGKLIV